MSTDADGESTNDDPIATFTGSFEQTMKPWVYDQARPLCENAEAALDGHLQAGRRA